MPARPEPKEDPEATDVEPGRGRLPLSIDGVTAAWLTAALSSYCPDIVVHDAKIVDWHHGFSSVVRLQVELNEAGRDAGIGPTIILKGGFEEHSRTQARGYALEAVAYRDLWPELGLNVPRVYFVGIEPERLQVILLMEDLAARRVVFSNPFAPHTFEQGKLYLSALAKLHAKTLNSPEIKPGGRWATSSTYLVSGEQRWLGIASNGAGLLYDTMTTYGYFTPEVWGRFLAMPRAAAISTHFLDLEWSRAALQCGAALTDALPKCVIHGDMHLGNLYWDADGTPAFYDSPARIEPPHVEVTYYLTCCFDPADRRTWEYDLTRHYLQELSDQGVEAPRLEEMMLYGGMLLINPLLVFFINERSFHEESFNTLMAMRVNATMMDRGAYDALSASMASGELSSTGLSP